MAHPYAGQKGGSKLLGRYGGASKQAASKAIEASARNTSTPKIGVSDLTPVANAALVLHMLTGEITTGNSPLYARVFYRNVKLALD